MQRRAKEHRFWARGAPGGAPLLLLSFCSVCCLLWSSGLLSCLLQQHQQFRFLPTLLLTLTQTSGGSALVVLVDNPDPNPPGGCYGL